MNKQQKRIRKTAAYRRRRFARVLRQLKRRSWWIVFGCIVAIQVVVQLLYPEDRTLPLARYNHEPYGFQQRDEMAIMEQAKFVATKLELSGSFGQERVDLVKVGARLVESANFETLRHYPNEWRWVPFSLFFFRPDVAMLPIQFDDAPLLRYSTDYAKKHSKKAVDASIAIKNGEVTVQDGRSGRLIDGGQLAKSIKQKRVDTSGIVRIDVPEKVVRPSATAADLRSVQRQAEEVVAKRIVVTVAGRSHEFTPSKEQIASWLRVVNKDNAPTLEVDTAAYTQYVDDINQQVAKPAGRTLVKMVDGQEVSRQEGPRGEHINRGDFEQKMSSVLLQPGMYKYIEVQLETLEPVVDMAYSYSHSQAGLQAKMNDIGRRYNVRISLQQLNGEGWRASYRGAESTPSASTYKLYVAIRLFQEIQSGRLTWQSPILGTTVEGCFHQMIIVSTNQCAEEWIRQFGRSELNTFLYERGVSAATSFTTGGAAHTSADDLLRTVIGINDSSLATGHEREKLLQMMSRQIWRQGIPAGTQGWAANKVGFLWDYVHDVGIVHHPRGAYAMAVMTKGASYGIIAQITRELEALMYP